MSILSGSRYVGVPITGIRTVDGKTKKFLHDRRIFSEADIGGQSIEHLIVGGETLDAIAERYYKNQNLWWLIADVNNIVFPLDIQSGQTVKIPNRSVLADLGLL